jgi:hypothetical protein
MAVAVPGTEIKPPKKGRQEDEHGVRSDGVLLESAVDALEPGYIDLGRLKPGTCFGMQSMQNERPHFGTIKALKRTHMLCLTKEAYNSAIKDIEKKREADRLGFVNKIPLFAQLSKQNVRKIIKQTRLVTTTKDCIV